MLVSGNTSPHSLHETRKHAQTQNARTFTFSGQRRTKRPVAANIQLKAQMFWHSFQSGMFTATDDQVSEGHQAQGYLGALHLVLGAVIIEPIMLNRVQ